MSIDEVVISSDVYLTCLSHAFCTEGEEIMGLLLGHVTKELEEHSNNSMLGKKKSIVESVVILQRSVGESNRVEISPLQLANAASRAESLTAKLGKPVRVLGWYHSHPHITVYPSHIDIGTQANYQAMDPDFIGVIFSVYQQKEADQKPQLQFAHTSFICFQAIRAGDSLKSSEIVCHIEPKSTISQHCLESLADITSTLYDEEKELDNRYSSHQKEDFLLQTQNAAVFTQEVSQIIECCQIPSISAVISYEQFLIKHIENLKRIKLEKERE